IRPVLTRRLLPQPPPPDGTSGRVERARSTAAPFAPMVGEHTDQPHSGHPEHRDRQEDRPPCRTEPSASAPSPTTPAPTPRWPAASARRCAATSAAGVSPPWPPTRAPTPASPAGSAPRCPTPGCRRPASELRFLYQPRAGRVLVRDDPRRRGPGPRPYDPGAGRAPVRCRYSPKKALPTARIGLASSAPTKPPAAAPASTAVMLASGEMWIVRPMITGWRTWFSTCWKTRKAPAASRPVWRPLVADIATRVAPPMNPPIWGTTFHRPDHTPTISASGVPTVRPIVVTAAALTTARKPVPAA